MADSLKSGEIVEIALHGSVIPFDRALATYANPDNWRRIHDEKGCHWVWQGSTICAYELAELALKYDKKECCDKLQKDI